MISALILDLDGLPRLRFGVSDSVSEEDGELLSWSKLAFWCFGINNRRLWLWMDVMQCLVLACRVFILALRNQGLKCQGLTEIGQS